jgi:hypothetical protein
MYPIVLGKWLLDFQFNVTLNGTEFGMAGCQIINTNTIKILNTIKLKSVRTESMKYRYNFNNLTQRTFNNHQKRR